MLDDLRQHIIDNYIKGDIPEAFDNQFDLIGSGILSSLALMQLLAHVEERYAVKFGDSDIIPEHFETVAALAEYISRRMAEGPSAAAPAATEQAQPARIAAPRSRDGDRSPIAIIGMGCRFPGAADSPDRFWELLQSGEDVIREVPPERWDADAYHDPIPNTPGKTVFRKGYFLDAVDAFDPRFFDLTPRESSELDPQQRLALEVAWETLEHANVVPSTLAGGALGIFLSSFWDDYSAQRLYAADPSAINRYAMLSNQRSMLAGRLAHFLDVDGPNVLVDTACSSSLTAVHLACRALQAHDCDAALAGGVYLLLSPEMMIGLSQMDTLALDGYSKTFDAAADGLGQGEGCGMILLKRLEDAQAAGDRVLAVIRGSAINHDGHSRTISTPSQAAQARLLRKALADADLTADQVQFIETHGTGTELGDPIEVGAIADVFSASTDGMPRAEALSVGAVKSNIGHLNAAAGVAGVMKVVLALQHRALPASLHVEQLNPRIDWAARRLQVQTALTPWEASGPRIGGVSSFGLSGSNAHVILEEAPPEPTPTPAEQPAASHCLLALSAKSPQALQAQARVYRDYLRGQADTAWPDICHAAARCREQFPHRLAVVADAPAAAIAQLERLGQAAPEPPSGRRPRIGFLFTGQGSQYPGMGRDLYTSAPAFRAVIDRCEPVFQDAAGRSLIALLYPETAPDHNDLSDAMDCAQAANYALQCALVDLWRSWGVEPDLVLGHSLGDFAAAYAAGVIGLEDGLRLVTERGRLIGTTSGRMVSVAASEQTVAPFLADLDDVSIAVINSPDITVISGGHDNVDRAAAALREAGHKTRVLDIPVAGHSPRFHPLLDPFEQAVRQVTLHRPRCQVVSSMTGRLVSDELTDPTYWRSHLHRTVRFADAAATLLAQQVDALVEIGPRGTLLGIIAQGEHAGIPIGLPSLHHKRPDRQMMLDALGKLYERGAVIAWEQVFDGAPPRHIGLPTYPFQRQRYWSEVARVAATDGQEAAAQPVAAPTPLVQQLEAGDLDALSALLADRLDPGERAALPAILERLAEEQQRQAAFAELRDWFYRVEWQAQPLAGDGFALAALCDRPRSVAEAQCAAPAVPRALDGLDALDALAVAYIRDAFRQAGIAFSPGSRWAPEQIIHQLGASDAQVASVLRLLRILTKHGVCTPDGDALVVRTEPATEVDKLSANLTASHGDVLGPELILLKRCGAALGEILRGRRDPLELLFAPEDTATAELFAATPPAAAMNAAIQAVVRELIDQLPTDTEIRILELGAGTAGTTAAVLPVLPAGRTDYWLTDIGATFLRQAERLVADHPFVSIRKLDIEQAPADQGFADQRFDIVLAGNVLHATRNLAETLAHVHGLLRPGGVLVLLEPTRVNPFATLTFGLTGAWDRCTDERGDTPTLTTAEWRELLPRCGFSSVTPVTDAALADGRLGQTLLVAQRPAEPLPAQPASCLIVAEADDALALELVRTLEEQGAAPPVLAETGETFRDDSARRCLIRQGNDEDLQRLLARHPEIEHVVLLASEPVLPLTSDALACGLQQGVTGVLALIRALARESRALDGLWLVTRSAQAVDEDAALEGLAASPLWGLGPLLALEHPELNCRCVDIDAAPGAARLLARELLAAPVAGEHRISYRDGIRRVARLRRAALDQPPPRRLALHAEATYLVTGGLGGLGLEAARWLVERGARHLLLVGRRAPGAEALTVLETLRAGGAEVRTAACDVADRDQLAALLASISPAAPLRGILHTAGVLEDGILLNQDWPELAAAMRPKVWGAWHLHELLGDAPLDFFVLFSSMATLLPDPGLGGYVAANGFLDQFADYRRRLGLPCLSVHWGLWDSTRGMTRAVADAASRRKSLDSMRAMPPTHALTALGFALEQQTPRVAIAAMDWSKSRQAPEPFYQALLPVQPARKPGAVHAADGAVDAGATPSRSILDELAGLPEPDRPDRLKDHLREQAARILRLPDASEIPAEEPLLRLGFDSLMMVELRNHVLLTWGINIPVVQFFEGMSIDGLSARLMDTASPPAETAAAAPAPSTAAEEPEWVVTTI